VDVLDSDQELMISGQSCCPCDPHSPYVHANGLLFSQLLMLKKADHAKFQELFFLQQHYFPVCNIAGAGSACEGEGEMRCTGTFTANVILDPYHLMVYLSMASVYP